MGMIKKPLNHIKDKDLRKTVEDIYEQGFGEPIEFEAEPTLEQMDSNQWGFFGLSMYIKLKNGTGLKITGTAMS
jgi:hypothetical protein